MMEPRMKTFDSVEMKHRGAQVVQQAIAGMTMQEELEFWQRGTEQLRVRQAEKQAEMKASKSAVAIANLLQR